MQPGTLGCFAHFWNRSYRDLELKRRLSGLSKTGQWLTLRGLQCESSTRRSQLAWSQEEGILNGLQDRPFSMHVTSSSRDISRARFTKRNQVQRRTWRSTSGTKWQEFLPPCCTSVAKLSETLAGLCWQVVFSISCSTNPPKSFNLGTTTRETLNFMNVLLCCVIRALCCVYNEKGKYKGTMTDTRLTSIITTYQQRITAKPYVPPTTFCLANWASMVLQISCI
jgi:hypothetical protein